MGSLEQLAVNTRIPSPIKADPARRTCNGRFTPVAPSLSACDCGPWRDARDEIEVHDQGAVRDEPGAVDRPHAHRVADAPRTETREGAVRLEPELGAVGSCFRAQVDVLHPSGARLPILDGIANPG